MPRSVTSLVYEMVDEAPPTNRGRGHKAKLLYTMLEKLIADEDHDWKRLVYSESRTGANSVLTRLRNGSLPTPDGEWEFRTATDPNENWSKLFARYVGPSRH